MKPKKIAMRVEEMLGEGTHLNTCIETVARRYNVRRVDVEIAAITYIDELWELWGPNRRRKR